MIKFLVLIAVAVCANAQRSFHMFPHASTTIMGQTRFPVSKGVGGFTEKNGIITYTKKVASPGPWQWLGWRTQAFAGKTITFSFSINFRGTVPSRSGNFGFKVYGQVYNGWVSKCKPNKWCNVQQTVRCAKQGDGYHMILIFDSIKPIQTILIKDLKVQMSNSLTVYDKTTKVMGKFGGVLPQRSHGGQMYRQMINDGKFNYKQYFVWENTNGRAAPMQWIGYQSRIFANKWVKMSFWIKFVEKRPNPSSNFGIKVYGRVYNRWVLTCKADRWCFVQKTVKCANAGDGNHVLLIFDSIKQRQRVFVGNMNVEIIGDRQTFVVLPTRPKIMNGYSLPRVLATGEMKSTPHITVRDKTFKPHEIIQYVKKSPGNRPWQWLGWQDRAFANKDLFIQFWVKFVGTRPNPSGNFGMKVYGKVINDWVNGCIPNQWCKFERVVRCPNTGDVNHVILIFDSIASKQVVQIARFNVYVL